VLTGLLALHRQEPQPLSKQSALQHLAQLSSRIDPNSRQRLDWLRMLELSLLREGSNDAALGCVSSLNAALAAPGIETNESELATALRMESARLAAFLQAGGSAEHLVNAMEHSPTQALQIHYFLCGSFLEQGWTPALNERVINWYEQTRTWEGGNSFQGYLRNFFGGHLDHISPLQMRQVFAGWRKHPFAMQTIIGKAQPQQVQDYDATVQKLLAEIESDPAGTHQGLIGLTIDALGKSSTPQSQAILQKLFDNNADRRDQLARSLAKHPIPQNVPYLVRSLRSRDRTTLQVCLQALAAADYKSDKPDEVRSVILAGLRLGPKAGPVALKLLKKWTGDAAASPGDFKTSIAHYQQWFQEKYPDSVPATLPKDDAEKTGYTFKQLVDFLDRNPAGQKGDVARGRQVFAKANCIKCHRFVKEGEGVGPDLTTVRRRFQRKEIVESVIYPSQVISDQYAAVTVQTVAGLVHTGMPLPNPGSENLLLLLPDATRLEIPKKEIEEKVVAKVSVMPEGLLKGLSLADIADLFAFLETSKNNAEPMGGGSVGRK
jgi:putative heme-binding domain-containing protein